MMWPPVLTEVQVGAPGLTFCVQHPAVAGQRPAALLPIRSSLSYESKEPGVANFLFAAGPVDRL